MQFTANRQTSWAESNVLLRIAGNHLPNYTVSLATGPQYNSYYRHNFFTEAGEMDFNDAEK